MFTAYISVRTVQAVLYKQPFQVPCECVIPSKHLLCWIPGLLSPIPLFAQLSNLITPQCFSTPAATNSTRYTLIKTKCYIPHSTCFSVGIPRRFGNLPRSALYFPRYMKLARISFALPAVLENCQDAFPVYLQMLERRQHEFCVSLNQLEIMNLS